MSLKDDIGDGFSVLIPTFNNLDCLYLLVSSLRKNSVLPIEIIPHVNEGSDGTLNWVRNEGLNYSWSKDNLGTAKAVNRARRKATKRILVFLNDDMYMAAGWDKAIKDYIESKGCGTNTCISGTLVQPKAGAPKSPRVIKNYGKCPKTFRQEEFDKDVLKLREEANKIERKAFVAPVVTHVDLWDEVGGYSEEFFSTLTDFDFAAKLYFDAGCSFVSLAGALGYHFVSRTRGRIKTETPNNRTRRQIFKDKFGVSYEQFCEELETTYKRIKSDDPAI